MEDPQAGDRGPQVPRADSRRPASGSRERVSLLDAHAPVTGPRTRATTLRWATSIVVAIATVVALLVLGIEGDRQLRISTERTVRSVLVTTLEAEKAALSIWADHHLRLAKTIAEDPRARDHAVAIATLPANTTNQSGEALLGRIGQELSSVLTRHGYVSLLVVHRDGRAVRLEMANGQTHSCTVLLSAAPPAVAALDGRSQLSPPAPPQEFLSCTGLDATRLEPTMYVSAPIRSGTETVAALLLGVPPAADFTRILHIARIGDSGETYAVDAHGRLISETRFHEELIGLMLLPPTTGKSAVLDLTIRDPGVDLTAGERPRLPAAEQPLTRSVRAATNGEHGVDVEGYRDYRGVVSVGAWTWLPSLGIGLVTELNQAEAYARQRMLRIGFWSIFVPLLASVLGLLGYTALVRILRRRVADARALGQYQLEEKLGQGGMGAVYRARHTLLARPAAIKVLDGAEATPMRIARFEREVHVTARLSHPNTVSVYDYGRTPEGTFYYAMELVDGVDLEQLVLTEGPQPPARVVHFLEQICGSLAEAHAAGSIHRDVKPANVMVTRQGGIADFVKVLDFGLARSVEQHDVRLTANHIIAGTPLYMSPEQVVDDDAIGPASDLYQLGALAYFLLAGREPFRATTYFELLHHHVSTPPVPPSKHLQEKLPGALEALVLECLEKTPERRPASAEALREQLERLDIPRWTRAEAQRRWTETARSAHVRIATAAPGGATVVGK